MGPMSVETPIGPRTSVMLDPDEAHLIDKYRKARAMKNGEINVAIRHSRLAKIWITEKCDINEFPLREGGREGTA